MRRTLVILLLLGAFGCQWSENRNLQRCVPEGELTGRWNITKTGIEGLAALDAADPDQWDYYEFAKQ
jgi:hypothetical protein